MALSSLQKGKGKYKLDLRSTKHAYVITTCSSTVMIGCSSTSATPTPCVIDTMINLDWEKARMLRHRVLKEVGVYKLIMIVTVLLCAFALQSLYY